jgi:hypothetical protein
LANKTSIKQKLQKELDDLKTRFNIGHELSLVYLPNEKRITYIGKELSGEVQNDCILIYESDPEKAIEILNHEFIENIINSISKPYLEIINSQNKVIERFLYLQREEVVNKISNGLNK